MKVTIAIILGLAALAVAKTVPPVHEDVHHEVHHEEKPEESHHHEEKRFSDVVKDDDTKFHDSHYYPYRHHDREYYRDRPYTYPERWVDYRQQFSPYDFSSKVHSKFDKLYEQKKVADHKTKKSTDVEEESESTDTPAVGISFAVFGFPIKSEVSEYESEYPYHGGNYRQNLGQYGSYYGRDYPSYYREEEIDYRIKQLRNTIQKLEEIKKMQKSYAKREEVGVEHETEENHKVPEHRHVPKHAAAFHHEIPPYYGMHY